MDQRTRTYQRGQIAPIALFGVLITSAALVLMFNTGQKITEKSNVSNAADAAAYSGAVWTARHLNFMAYSNRAMIANHIAVGHYVSYTSWLRYVHDTIERIDQVAQWIPYVSDYVNAAEEIAQELRETNDDLAPEIVQGIDLLNSSYRMAQVETQASLALTHLNELMTATARTYDPDVRINEQNDIAQMPSALQGVVQAQVIAQMVSVPTFVRRYSASEDQGRLNQVITASINATENNRRWIAGRRGWSDRRFPREIRKEGSTRHSQTGNNADWRASDQIRYRVMEPFGWSSWRSFRRASTASARELYDDYRGVPHYYNVDGREGHQSLRIGVVATKRQSRVETAPLLGMQSSAQPIAASAMARVEFRRPSGNAFSSLGNSRAEYSNLFNPFWNARLVPVELNFEGSGT